MVTVARLNLGAFADSPYASELEHGPRKLRFSERLEPEYIRDRLIDNRTLIRVAALLATLLAVLRGVEQGAASAWNGILLFDFGLVVAGSIALTSIAWSANFERSYLTWARLVVPLRNVIVAAHVAEAASRGQVEVLMGLPLMLIGPFLFFGLGFRVAFISGVLTVLSFVGSAIHFELAVGLAIRSSVFLILAAIACAFAALHLERRSRTSFLERRLIAELAQQDPLTGTKNRRVFDEHFSRVWQQGSRDSRAIALLLIDVDHFKAYNDRYGHQAGDETLRRVAQAVQKLVHRPLDTLARYGGEEFAAILYDVDPDRAQNIAERVRRAVADLRIEHRGSRTASCVTISVGVAVIEPSIARSAQGALQLADQALYEAKVRGRNRVELAGDAQHSLLQTGVFSNESLGRG